jgi:hypothetical protein
MHPGAGRTRRGAVGAAHLEGRDLEPRDQLRRHDARRLRWGEGVAPRVAGARALRASLTGAPRAACGTQHGQSGAPRGLQREHPQGSARSRATPNPQP